MAWFKVDDGLHSSRKVMSIPRGIRLAAVGLWTIAGSWSAQEELDGFVPDYMVKEWGGTPKLVDALVASGLWVRVPDGTRFEKWSEYQPTRADLEEQRRKERERKAEWRARKAGQNGMSQRDTRGTDVGATADETWDSALSRPVPSRPHEEEQLRDHPESLPAPAEDDISHLSPVIAAVVEATAKHGLRVHPLCAPSVMEFIDERRGRNAQPVKMPTRYYPDAIARSWPEVEQFIYEKGLAS